ncbi:MAG TPA: N-acetyltransferase [Gammaproteobacteria bacterium]|nr:N-acetyltransferase [Gammaproteobacteria bacterium]
MTPAPYSIRPARPDEAQTLSALACRSKAHWGYSAAFLAACRDELTYSAEQIGSQYFQFSVVEVNGTVIGFYALEPLSPAEMELEALFVEPKHIGQGYGRALIEDAKRKAAERGASVLIIQGDPNAAAFYRAAGGRAIGQRESDSIAGRFLPVFSIALENHRQKLDY